jgi:poly(A) polymerase
MGRNRWYLTPSLCETIRTMSSRPLHFDALPALLERPHVRHLLSLLNDAENETRLIGGAVRNALLGQEVTEIDFATTALPDAVMARATKAGLRTIPTGYEHGTVTLLIDDHAFEITTLRHDVTTDGRRAQVAFGRSFAEDAMRRDLTVNALSLDAQGHIHDYVGGLDDLAAGRIRFIGPPRQRIREDYLRSLRFFRFHATYATTPVDEDALAAIISECEGLKTLSKERIRAELLKLLRATGAADVIELIAAQHLDSYLLTHPINAARLRQFIRHEAEAYLDPQRKSLARLAALCVHTDKDATRLQHDLRLSNAETMLLHKSGAALDLLQHHVPPTHHLCRHMLYLYGREASQLALSLAQADHLAALDAHFWHQAHDVINTAPIPSFPLRGADLIKRGYERGPALGIQLKEIENRWIAADFPSSIQEIEALFHD